MSREKRSSPRIKANFRVELSSPQLGIIETRTRDVSEGGAFVIIAEETTPELHMKVQIRVLDLPGEPGQSVESEVVRIENEGVGLRFIPKD
ncbi:PilZ domain-containing protein [Hahella aquimaris]|uniref:PilZ domain-containing protein n=1 Tax=Hahella sp. HNIBRBA332 TaxID=3015983 RepID=UPI00273C73E3|nr:PilZ domain-containing protein [Hahella sp. HNIBRBA332]WLQ14826.1 PilZ domain-containing protein [Hahella sp. HNIBRBA332]